MQDRTIYEDAYIFAPNLHAMGLMTTRDFENYHRLFQNMEHSIVPPDLLIYLQAPVDKLVRQIGERGREYENSISIEYLKRLNERYDGWIEKYDKGKLLVIDVEDNAFHKNPEDLGKIINAIDAMPDASIPDGIGPARATADGAGLDLPIRNVVVTYLKPQIGSTTNDPAGFTIQAQKTELVGNLATLVCVK